MTQCSNCGFDAGDGKFCPNCGSEIIIEKANVCPSCGHDVEGSAFCSNCGTKIGGDIPEPTCPNCGNPLKSDSKFCPNCGFSNASGEDGEDTFDSLIKFDDKISGKMGKFLSKSKSMDFVLDKSASYSYKNIPSQLKWMPIENILQKSNRYLLKFWIQSIMIM